MSPLTGSKLIPFYLHYFDIIVLETVYNVESHHIIFVSQNMGEKMTHLHKHKLLMQVRKVLRQRVTDKALCSKKRVEQSIGLVQIGKHLVQTEFRQSLSALVQDA